jgi:hypothetical protein
MFVGNRMIIGCVYRGVDECVCIDDYRLCLYEKERFYFKGKMTENRRFEA